MEVQVVDVRGRPRGQEEVVARLGAVVERALPRIGGRIGGRIAPARVSGEPGEGVHDPERAVVVPIVPNEHVRWGSLRRRRGERRMRVDHPHDGLPARVRDSPLPHPAVVALQAGERPFDGVVVVGALVDRGGPFRLLGQWADHLEVAVGPELAAHVLEDEHVPRPVELGGRAERVAVPVRLVWRDRVGCAEQHDRHGFGREARRVDDREELDPVPHGDPVRALVVVVLEPGHVGVVAAVRGLAGARPARTSRRRTGRIAGPGAEHEQESGLRSHLIKPPSLMNKCRDEYASLPTGASP